MISIICPICGCEIELDERIHLCDDQERTEYCDICENILTIKNRRVVRPTVNELLGILGE